MSAKPNKPTNLPDADEYGMPENVLEIMHSIGYVHESELQKASSTTPRTRARWKSPRGVMFGNERWFPVAEVKRYLDAKIAESDTDDHPVVL
jgi:hypothetical protein